MLGLGLASNLYSRFVNIVTLTILLLFSVFLLYNIYVGREDNCQCFGSLLSISPIQSLAKNAILLLWLWLVSKVPSFTWRPQWYLWIVLIILCTALPFFISKPDHWIYHDKDKDIPYNITLFKEQITNDSTFINKGIKHGNKIVAFVSPYCPYCKMSVEKIQTLQQRYHLPDTSFIYIIPQPPQPIETVELDYIPTIINRELFSNITYGQRPVIVFVSDGTPIQSIHYRAIDENEFNAFLSSN